MLLEGKVALIAGNATEIGRATAIAMSAAGASVVIGDRDLAPWISTIAMIQTTGGNVLFHPTDVTVARSVKALIAQTAQTFGKLDAAFNNTCINAAQVPLAEQEEFEIVGVIDQNLNGLWLCLKYEMEQMLKESQGNKAIVNNSSILGLTGCANDAIYVATKHAITGMTKAAALDYAERGIRVNAVAASSETQTSPMGRTCKPEEVANAVVWLCSDQASFITGHTLPIDGGCLAQ